MELWSSGDPTPARSPTISADGRTVAWLEVPIEERGTLRKPCWQVVVRERGSIQAEPGIPAVPFHDIDYPPRSPSLSGDGRYMAFAAEQGDGAVQACVIDRFLGEREVASVGQRGALSDRAVSDPALSPDGRFVVFCTDSLELARPCEAVRESRALDFIANRHVFVRDREKQTTRYASDLALKLLGFSDYSDPLISSDGGLVAYNHNDTRKMGCLHVSFVSDLAALDIERLLPVNEQEWFQGQVSITSMTPDARWLVVESWRGDLAGMKREGDQSTQVFLLDREKRSWAMLSARPDGFAGRGASRRGAISADARFVAFESEAGDLVSGDENGCSDVFVRDLQFGTTERVSVPRRR
jgi:hypothetical protein